MLSIFVIWRERLNISTIRATRLLVAFVVRYGYRHTFRRCVAVSIRRFVRDRVHATRSRRRSFGAQLEGVLIDNHNIDRCVAIAQAIIGFA